MIDRCVICNEKYEKWEMQGYPLRYCCENHWYGCIATDTGIEWNKYMKKYVKIKNKKFGKAVWTTICPTKDITIDLLHKKIGKLTQGSIIKKGWWAYEWRHNISNWNGPNCDLDNNGLHCHLYCKVTNVNNWKTKVKKNV